MEPFSTLPVRRVERDPAAAAPPRPRDGWPWALPAVAHLLAHGLDLGPLTVIVGQNGAGKSTLVEAVALAFGLSPEGGGTGARHTTRVSESPLHEELRIVRGPGSARWGYFLRAETMHGLLTYLENNPRPGEAAFHEASHGEAFLSLTADPSRFAKPGFFVFDEPEAGLSFPSQMLFAEQVVDMVEHGAQVLIATHSPVIAALQGATLLQVDESGLTQARWDELSLVDQYRRFLSDPEAYRTRIWQ
ncbi:AAA family ATPase [Cellulomonas soli]|uniref:ABC transporter, ATP-binding protein n=1 Tax=Cellulomonas soli TaxID=931535 RepID=A0A512PHM8_9CELL|nr:AAA family ATPase [Cellulomonas soli]NYI60784.1 putative ATPase [Cellulomonas soli]GEP70632.1 ABC transporter, ATP-binding protein [Cellulomonas soli]